jgi:RimJ/RimL family protein N-acetyltransferase
MDYYSQETERIILRKLTEADIETWAEFFVDNPNARFIGLDLSLPKHELAKTWIDKQLKRYSDNQFGQLAANILGKGIRNGNCHVHESIRETE